MKSVRHFERHRSRPRVAGPIAAAALVTAAAWAYGTYGLTPVYRGTAVLTARPAAPASAPAPTLDASNDARLIERLLADENLLLQAAAVARLADVAVETAAVAAGTPPDARRLRRSVRLTTRTGRNGEPIGFEITADWPSSDRNDSAPVPAQRFADALAGAVIERMTATRADQMRQRRGEAESRLASLRARLAEPAEAAWRQFTASLSNDDAAALEHWYRTPAALSDAEAALDALRADVAKSARQRDDAVAARDELAAGLPSVQADEEGLRQWPAALVPALDNRPALRGMSERIAALRAELTHLQARYTTAHPFVRRAREELDGLLRQLRRDWSAELAALDAHVAAMDARLAERTLDLEQRDAELSRRRTAAAEYRRLRTAAENARRRCDEIAQESERRLHAEQAAASAWERLAPASATQPGAPLRTRTWLMTGATMVGSMVAAAAAIRARAAADRPLADADEAAAVTGLPVLAAVPFAAPTAAAWPRNPAGGAA